MIIPLSGPAEFSKPNAIIVDTIKVFYQFSKEKKWESRTNINFVTGAYPGVKNVNPNQLPFQQPLNLPAIKRTGFMAENIYKTSSSWNASKGNNLQTVTVRTTAKSKLQQLDENYTSGMFSGGSSYNLDLTDYRVSGIGLINYLRGQAPGIQINEGEGELQITWRGAETSVFVDEISRPTDEINSLQMADIAYIKIFRPPFFGGAGGGAGGAIAIYTRRGNDVKSEPGKGLPSGKIAGYSTQKQYYIPDYSTPALSSNTAADYRTTLYWNPLILTDSSLQKTTIKFYNNDITKAFRVILQGFNEAGKLVYVEKVFKPAGKQE